MYLLHWAAIVVCVGIAWWLPKLGDSWIRPIERCFSGLAAHPGRAIFGLFFATIAIRLALLPLIPVPVPGVHDEFSYLLQADTFAHGRLANPPHPMWKSFETFHVNWFPAYSSMFPPAQSLVLALGQVMGDPWIGVLLSCAAMVAAVTWMLQGWMPPRWALLGGFITLVRLGITSYWMNSYWGGAVAASGGALVAGAIPRIVRRPKASDGLFLGLGVAILMNSRPLEGFILCLPAAGIMAAWLVRRSAIPPAMKLQRIVAPAAACLLLAGAFALYDDWRLTGHPFTLPHSWYDKDHRVPLFLWNRYSPPKHYADPLMNQYYGDWIPENYDRSWRAVRNASFDKLESYNSVFFWRGAALMLFFLPAALFSRKMKYLTVTLGVSLVGLFLVVWWMPHYVAPLLCVIYALCVQSIRHMRALRVSRRPVGVGLSRAVFFFLLLMVALALYKRIWHPQWDWNGDMGLEARATISKELEATPGKHLVLVRYGADHNVHEEWVYNRADIDGSKVVWAHELDPQQNARLFAYFRDRRVWLVTPDSDDEQIAPYAPSDPKNGP